MAACLQPEMLAERILPRQVLAGEALIDDRYAARRRRVALVKGAAAQQPRADGLEVVSAHPIEGWRPAGVDDRFALDADRERPVHYLHGAVQRQAGARHARGPGPEGVPLAGDRVEPGLGSARHALGQPRPDRGPLARSCARRYRIPIAGPRGGAGWR